MIRLPQMERCDPKVVALSAFGGTDSVPPRTITDDDLAMVGVSPKIIGYLLGADPVTRAEFYDLALLDLMGASDGR